MNKKALIVRGGWDGHEPMLVSERMKNVLENEGFEVEVSDTLDIYLNVEHLLTKDLIVSLWTMGTITKEQCKGVMEAVEKGVGLAGSHGGMCDSYRENVDWQFMTGGQWVAHPGGEVDYEVNIKWSTSPITYGLKDYKIHSEQYYVQIDPCIEVLATTNFPNYPGPHTSNRFVTVPVTWTKRWGKGRVFYTSMGHHDDIFDIPEVMTMMVRGMLWAAEGKKVADEDSEFSLYKNK